MNENEKNFGVPKVDSSPMGIINMEGRFYRGLAESKSGRPMWVRVCGVFFSLFIILPGLMSLFVAVVSFVDFYKENNLFNYIAPVASLLAGLLFCGVGLKILIANMSRPK